MRTVELFGATFHCTEKTIKKLEALEWELVGRQRWLSDPANKLDINYSDIFKDEYGFRPL